MKEVKKVDNKLVDYKAWVNDQFSLWDGSHKKLVELIKENSNDAKSFEHVKTTYNDDIEGTLIIHMVYRSRNPFGGLMLRKITVSTTRATGILEVIPEN